MVTVRQLSKINYNEYDEIWAIVRSLKYDNPNIRQVPELSPAWGLFNQHLRMKEDGIWNKDTFESIYVPQFLKYMRGREQQALMNELFNTKKHICLVCFCPEEELCHRSIVGGMLQGAGLEVGGLSRDYSHYFSWWKDGVPENIISTQPYRQAKPVTDYNSSITYLYEQDAPQNDAVTMCFTGRRPKDLCGYDVSKYRAFVSDLSELLYAEFYEKRGVRRFLTGGAQGFDQMTFWAVERMRKAYECKDISNEVFVPFEGQDARWAKTGLFSQAEYGLMLKNADAVSVVCADNTIEALFLRNHAMCEHSTYCLALYPDDGWNYAKGGTAECMRHAKSAGVPLYQLRYNAALDGLHIGELSEV